MQSNIIDLRPIKRRALAWPDPVKSLILSESDSILFADFITKLGVWERLLSMYHQVN